MIILIFIGFPPSFGLFPWSQELAYSLKIKVNVNGFCLEFFDSQKHAIP